MSDWRLEGRMHASHRSARPSLVTRLRPRRPWAAVLGLLLLVSLLTAPYADAAQPVDEVHYTFTSQTSVAIDWRGDANDVRWGPTTDYGNVAQGVAPQWTPWSSPGPFWQL